MPVVNQGGVYCIQVQSVFRYCRVRNLAVTVEYLGIDQPFKVYLLPRAGGRAPSDGNENVCGLLMLEYCADDPGGGVFLLWRSAYV